MNPQANMFPDYGVPQMGLSGSAGLAGHAGAFSIDTYLPALPGIATALGATPIEMQQTLSAYLSGSPS